MPISVRCPACGRGHSAPDRAAGRTLKCLACGGPLVVPAAELDAAALLLDDDSAPTAAGERFAESEPEPAPPPRPVHPKPTPAALPPLTTYVPPLWRRHLHWLLALAMIPLAVSLLGKADDRDLFERIGEALREAPPEVQARLASKLTDDMTLDDLIGALPGQRLPYAWLGRNTYAHWGLALAATALFLVFFMFLASDGSAQPTQVLAVGLFTATVGVGLLLLTQLIASATDGRMIIGRGVLVLVFALFKFIAFSYNAANDPENGFLLSFVGFTLGVGLCEELVKTAPLFWHGDGEKGTGKTWRGLFIWGLASGAGFGIAEGILYSGRYYNGISGVGTYVVRFVSCVALHAVWTGSAAVTLYLRRDSFDKLDTWHEWVGPVLAVIGVPMVLHGLYDTCLKRDLNAVALVVAAASFGWLAFLGGRLYGTDDEAANRAMLAEYRRRRKAMA